MLQDRTNELKYTEKKKNTGVKNTCWKVSNPIVTPGGTQKMTCINEAGLYRLVMRSDKPQAQAFQNWIVNELLIMNPGLWLKKCAIF